MIRLFERDLFEASAEALLITLDGSDRRDLDHVAGNLGHAFARRWPEAWEEVCAVWEETQTLSPGSVAVVELGVGECPFEAVVLAATLVHIGDTSSAHLAGLVRGAVGATVRQAKARGWDAVASAVMRGGWRIESVSAFRAMFEGYRNAVGGRGAPVPDLHVHEVEPGRFTEITKEWERICRTW